MRRAPGHRLASHPVANRGLAGGARYPTVVSRTLRLEEASEMTELRRISDLERRLAATERLAALLIKFIITQCANGRLGDEALRRALLKDLTDPGSDVPIDDPAPRCARGDLSRSRQRRVE